MSLRIFNTLTRSLQPFTPLEPGHVRMYVCGMTIYDLCHIGHARMMMAFDVVQRWLKASDLKVTYVRNITDAGHITNSAGNDEDSIGKAARAEQLQSLEIVYKYNVRFQDLQRIYNLLPPSIEPTATGHIQEQIEVIEQILANGYGYVVNGSVYFDTKRYMQDFNYGILSGRKVDELENDTRQLNAQDEKRFFADFALWKKANHAIKPTQTKASTVPSSAPNGPSAIKAQIPPKTAKINAHPPNDQVGGNGRRSMQVMAAETWRRIRNK